MTREEAIKYLNTLYMALAVFPNQQISLGNADKMKESVDMAIKALEQEQKWIPVSEQLPDNTDPVNITWVNHNPEPYYADIKDKPFTATGCYCNGKWYWYSVTCQDYLDEYGFCNVDAMDEVIEVIAWMPLPLPYKAESEETIG